MRFVTLTCLAVAFASAQDAAKIEKGRYLLEEVAKCQDCHTPRLEDGELDKNNWLKGAVLDFQPMNPVPDWHTKSPSLRSTGRLWQNWGEEKLINYLVTGLTPRGTKAGPPMPTYTMKREDAEAVVAYLKSLDKK
jgi:mono/diheme cytochrome c family protein